MTSKPFLAGGALAIAIGAAAACNETFPRASTDSPRSDAGLYARPSNTTCFGGRNPPGRVRLEAKYTGFTRPVAMVDRPDLGLLYVAELPGRVKAIDHATGTISTVLDLTGKVGNVPGFEDWGFYGFAIHPTKPYAYVTVERALDPATNPPLPNRTELVRFALLDGGRTFDPASESLVLRVDRPLFPHSPGTVEFGPDGYLYVGIGDGAATYVPDFDPKDTLLGSIVRLDVDGAEPYAIPPDNPFAAGGGRPEIFARGFRNPWRFTFDRANGEIWLGDVGNTAFEEINKVERGKNYGWPTTEGTACFQPRVGCDPTGLTMPVFTYPHAEGASVTGGYVYRGKDLPELSGRYVFGDFILGRIWMLDRSGAEPKAVLLNSGGAKPSISSFGEDASGELYVLDWEAGTIYRVLPGSSEPPPSLPAKLSATGCVNASNPTEPAPGLVPYGVNVELWSDGAEKKRFVAIPDGTTLKVEDDGALALPEGGVLIKEFSVAGKRVETRFIIHHPGGDWTGATYEWNDEQTDAALLDSAKTKALPNGQAWTFPSPAQCFVCHTNVARRALGLEVMQLNRDFSYGPIDQKNQLTKLSEIGFLDKRIDLAATPALPSLTSSAPLEERARAYLHVNCSICHREGGGTFAPMDLRFTQPRAALNGCATSAFEGVDDVKILAPGDPGRSAIALRMGSRGGYQMPPLGTSIVDEAAVSVIEEWIRSVDTCK